MNDWKEVIKKTIDSYKKKLKRSRYKASIKKRISELEKTLERLD